MPDKYVTVIHLAEEEHRLEAPQFRAAAAGGIPRSDVVPIVAEAAARLRKDLLAMIEVVDGMAAEVRRSGLPPLVPSDVK